MKEIIRASTIASSLDSFCKGALHILSNEYHVVALSSPDPILEEIGNREKVNTIGISMERRMSPFKDLRSLLQLIRVFRTERPDMVHSMTPKAGLLCMMAGWMAGVPVRVHTFTGLVWPTSTGLTRRILMATDWLTCACATHVIPEGYGVLEDLAAHITKKPMCVLGYGNVRGVDLNYWCRSEKLGLDSCDERPFTFLFVGRIVGDKGINELVSAFSILLSRTKEASIGRGKKCRLVLVGRFEAELDPIKEESLRLIDSIEEIEAVGPKFGDELLAYYAAADCFVFPSYREGFPNTVLEAGALEVPSIVTDINGSSEIIINTGEKVPQHLGAGESLSVRENGVMIPSKNVDALYEAMVWMMEHPDERKKMGKRAREIVAERWEQGFVREKQFEFYREVLGE